MTKRKMFFRMITASLVRRRSRMLVALLAIAVGATILSGLVTIYYDVPRQMGAQFRNYGANMIFVASSTDAVFDKTSVDEGVSMINAGDVVGVAPYRYETVRIHEQPVVAAGTDIEGAKATSPYWKVSGQWPSIRGDVLVGKNVANTLALKEGSMINVTYSDGEEEDDEDLLNLGVDMTVVGILETGGSEEDYVYMFMEDLEELAGEGELDVAELSVSGTQDELSAYVDKISGSVDSVSARLVKRLTQSESTVLTKLQALVFLVTAVVLVLTMICVATTMTAVVAERRKEIGLRKALGASDSEIIHEFMGEGLLLGGIGGILGSILGFVFAQLVSVNVFASSITFQPLLVPVTIIVSILVTGIACLIPVRSATEVDPALVLKGE
ncbi:MAG: ABC transporter permease [Oscillospiraceae bacterium]|nr:ABC transporter permease [Oscillospiraceae bacterium]